MEKTEKYKRIFVPLLATISVLILVVSLLYSIIFYRVTLSKTDAYMAAMLHSNAVKVQEMVESAKTALQQVAFNSIAYRLMRYRELDVPQYQQSLAELRRMLSLMSGVESIYLYNAATGDVFVGGTTFRQSEYTLDTLPDVSFAACLERQMPAYGFTPISRTILCDNPSCAQRKLNVFTFLYALAPTGTFARRDTVAVNVRQDVLRPELEEAADGAESFLFAVTPEGRLEYASCGDEMARDAARQISSDTAERLVRGDLLQGQSAKLNGGEYYLRCQYEPASNWIVALAIPYAVVSRESNAVIRWSALISAGILLLAGLLALYTGRRIYQRSGMAEVQHVLQQSRANERLLQEQLLKRLLTGGEACEEPGLSRSLTQCGLHLNAGEDTQLVGVRIDHWQSVRQSHTDEQLRQVVEAVCHCFAAQAEEEPLGTRLHHGEIMLVWQPAAPVRPDALLACGLTCQNEIYKRFDIGISIMAAKQLYPLAEIGDGYETLSEALYLERLFHGYGICACESAELPNEKVYPKQAEKALLEGVRLNDFSCVKRSFDQFVDALSHNGLHYINLGLVHLVLMLDEAVEAVLQNNQIVIPPHTFDIYIHFDDVERIEEISQRFYHMFDELETTLLSRRSGRQKELAERIARYIQANVTDPDLSRQQIADVLHVSYTSAGVAFKAHFGVGISAYITDARLHEARARLEAQTASIDQIATDCGFASGVYFYKVFKKQYGVTPGEYRKIVQTNDSWDAAAQALLPADAQTDEKNAQECEQKS